MLTKFYPQLIMWMDERRRSHDVKEGKRNGISVRIRPAIKDGTTCFVVDYRVQGQRKLVWRFTPAKAF